jgi:hypothetical protein
MRLIKPQVLTLNSSTVTEAAHSEWLVGSTYAIGNKVYVTKTEDTLTEVTPHKIYESLTGSNIGNYPPDDTTNWLDIGATNRWKMFDDYVSSITSKATSINVNITPADKSDTIALFNVAAVSATIVCTSGATEIYNETSSLINEDILDWYDYFFSTSELKTDLIITIPALYLSMTVDITLTNPGGTAECGHCVCGLSQSLGQTLYAPSISINDYSTKETNDYGETYLLQRTFAKSLDAVLSLPTGKLDAVAGVLTKIRATPCVWQFNNIGTDYTSLIVFGFFRDFDLILQNFNQSECNLEIEGLI